MINGRFIAWLADSNIRGLTNWLNDLWLVDLLNDWLYCPWTNQVSEWFMADWLND